MIAFIWRRWSLVAMMAAPVTRHAFRNVKLKKKRDTLTCLLLHLNMTGNNMNLSWTGDLDCQFYFLLGTNDLLVLWEKFTTALEHRRSTGRNEWRGGCIISSLFESIETFLVWKEERWNGLARCWKESEVLLLLLLLLLLGMCTRVVSVCTLKENPLSLNSDKVNVSSLTESTSRFTGFWSVFN